MLIKPPDLSYYIGIVTGCEKLNVRSTASTLGDRVDTLKVGSMVGVYPDSIGREFYKIRMYKSEDDFTDGYCMSKFVSIVTTDKVLTDQFDLLKVDENSKWDKETDNG